MHRVRVTPDLRKVEPIPGAPAGAARGGIAFEFRSLSRRLMGRLPGVKTRGGGLAPVAQCVEPALFTSPKRSRVVHTGVRRKAL